jgi:cytoskeletal protein RodZ
VGGPVVAPEHSAEDIGRILRSARQRLGWSVEQAGAATAIPAVYVDALEHGRLDLLPGPVYTRGYIRTYATALHLDGDEFTYALTRLQPQGRFDALGAAPRGPRRSQSNVVHRLGRIGLVALGLLLGLLLLSALWAAIGPDDDGGSIDPPVTRPTTPQAASPPLPQTPAGPQVAATPPLAPTSNDTEGAVYAVGRPAFTVTVVATGRSWLQMRSEDGGEILYEGTLEPGQTQAVPATTGALWMRIGDQSVVGIMVDGTPLVIPGEAGLPYNVDIRT